MLKIDLNQMVRTGTFRLFFLLYAIFLWLNLTGCESEDPVPEEIRSTQQLGTSGVRRIQDWPMFMSDLKQSGRSNSKEIKPPLELKWKFKTGGQIQASPIVVKDVVYVGSNDNFFYALSAKSWGVKWKFRASGAIRFSAAVWNDFVFFSATDGIVYALNLITGEEVWSFKVQNWVNGPILVDDGTVYVGSYNHTIYLLHSATGKLLRKVNKQVQINDTDFICHNGRLMPSKPTYQIGEWENLIPFSQSYPVIANGTVYIGSRDNHLYAIDPVDQNVVWRYQTAGYIDSAPAIAGNMLYATSYDGYIYAFSALKQLEKKSIVATEVGTILGTIVQDTSPVYRFPEKPKNTKEKSSIIVELNDGVVVPILENVNLGQKRNEDHERFRQIQLPNGHSGWVVANTIGRFSDEESIQFNMDICGQIESVSLINGAEVPKWSPDGKSIAFMRRTNLSGQYWQASELWTFSTTNRQFYKQCKGSFYNPNLSWSLDSKWIIFEAYEDNQSYIWAINSITKELIKIAKGDAPACSPVANQIAFRRWEDNEDILCQVNIDGSSLQTIARIPINGQLSSFSYLAPPAWSPDGKRIAFGLDGHHFVSGRSEIAIYTTFGHRLQTISTQSRRIQKLVWSADGTHLSHVQTGLMKLDSVLDKRLHITNSKQILDTKVFKHTAPAWSPTDRRLVFMERSDCMGIQWLVWVYDLKSHSKWQIARTNLRLTNIHWLPDGDRVCLWHTSKYLRSDKSEKKVYRPADTKGWIVHLKSDNKWSQNED